MRAPSRFRLKCAFRATSGSNVQNIVSHADGAHDLALVMLESLAELLAARILADGEHVGPVDQTTVAHAGEPEHETEHATVRRRTQRR